MGNKNEIRDSTNKLLYFTKNGVGGRLDVRLPSNKLLGWCKNGETRDHTNKLVCKGEAPDQLYSNYIRNLGSSQPRKQRSSKEKSDDIYLYLFLIVIGIVVSIVFLLSPGILIIDILSDKPEALGEKWISVSLISLVIAGIIYFIKRKEVTDVLIYYAIVCLISSVILIILWYFFDASPLSGTRGYILWEP